MKADLYQDENKKHLQPGQLDWLKPRLRPSRLVYLGELYAVATSRRTVEDWLKPSWCRSG